MKTKICSKCKRELDTTQFSKNKSRKDGLCSECKECYKKWYEENREKQLEYKKKWHEENREKQLEYTKKWYEENKEKALEYAKKWREENREKRLEYAKKWYEENREKQLEYYKSRNGKISRAKSNNKRKRQLGFELLFDNQFNGDIDYHHISDAFVFAIPRDIHRNNLGKGHREKLKPIVEKLYNISYCIVTE